MAVTRNAPDSAGRLRFHQAPEPGEAMEQDEWRTAHAGL